MGLLRLLLTIFLAPPLLVGAAVCAAAAMAAQKGRTNLRWDLLTHFTPIWLAGGLIAALIASVAFRGFTRIPIVAVGLLAVAAAGALMWPELTRDTGPKAGRDAP